MAKRGRKKADAAELRTVRLDLHLSAAEAVALDHARGKMGRCAYIRAALTHNAPAQIPALNLHAWIDLGRALGNLSALAGMSRSGQYIDVGKAREAVNALRAALTGASQKDAD
jgi:hypothetical protein